jgi:hypothetical protein
MVEDGSRLDDVLDDAEVRVDVMASAVLVRNRIVRQQAMSLEEGAIGPDDAERVRS